MTEQEFNQMILPLAKNVYSYAMNIIKDQDDAADITQDVLVKSWDQRNLFRKINNPKAWLLKMTRNLCLDWLKKQKPTCDTDLVIQTESNVIDPLQEIETRDMAKLARQIISTLPSQQQEILILRELEEMEFDEIAQITGLSINHIRVLLSRGRKTIREKLGNNRSYIY